MNIADKEIENEVPKESASADTVEVPKEGTNVEMNIIDNEIEKEVPKEGANVDKVEAPKEGANMNEVDKNVDDSEVPKEGTNLEGNRAHNDCAKEKRTPSHKECGGVERNGAHYDCAMVEGNKALNESAKGVETINENETENKENSKLNIKADANNLTPHETNAQDNGTKPKDDEPIIIPPKRTPDKVEEKKMLAKTVQMMALLGMENHVYKFANVLCKQKSGGPIGLALTGDIADCYLIEWDKRFIKKLESMGMNLIFYKRFKDDITIMVEALAKGSKFEEEKLTVDTEKEKTDEYRNDDEITMEVVVNIAESVDGIIKFSFDIPSNHKSCKLPVLDVELNINKIKENLVEYEFYEKPTKNKRVIFKDAALPSNQKRTILTQECLRRLRNTKVELGEQIRVKHLNNFMLVMKNSGFNEKYRTEILDSALSAFDKILLEDKSGTKPLFRSRDWNKEERNKKKNDRKNNWYNTGSNEIEYQTVLMVPVTKGGVLVKDLQRREEEINRNSDERIKMVEGGAIQIKNLLVVKDPFPQSICEMKKCILCKNSMGNKINRIDTPCNVSNVGYRLVCETCEERGIIKVYEGETSRWARVREAEHRRDFLKGKDDSALYKHQQNDHINEDMAYRMEITKRFQDPLTRQANEAVRIGNRGKNELLNSKNEFNHPPIARITVEGRKNYKYKNVAQTAQPSLYH